MELSEEEKKAIERIEDTFYQDLGKGINKFQKITLYEDDIADIRKLLNLIDKQRKDYISKDKIREIIKHYNNELEHIKNGEEFENEKPMYYWGKVALEDLLEEN